MARRSRYHQRQLLEQGERVPSDEWLNATTARMIERAPPPSSKSFDHEDLQLIMTPMTCHAQRVTTQSALKCKALLRQIAKNMNAYEGNRNFNVRVSTKMYMVAMGACAKSQRRPISDCSVNTSNPEGSVPITTRSTLPTATMVARDDCPSPTLGGPTTLTIP